MLIYNLMPLASQTRQPVPGDHVLDLTVRKGHLGMLWDSTYSLLTPRPTSAEIFLDQRYTFWPKFK